MGAKVLVFGVDAMEVSLVDAWIKSGVLAYLGVAASKRSFGRRHQFAATLQRRILAQLLYVGGSAPTWAVFTKGTSPRQRLSVSRASSAF